MKNEITVPEIKCPLHSSAELIILSVPSFFLVAATRNFRIPGNTFSQGIRKNLILLVSFHLFEHPAAQQLYIFLTLFPIRTQLTFTCAKSAIKTLDKGVKRVQN